ncbi:MAG TPA: alpha/beta hydrolase [Patescibacteria group bacterium]|nr:alpha/beta hydrolase [Patescibacteria group bacterium]
MANIFPIVGTFSIDKNKPEHYWTLGKSDKPVLLLIPGYSGNHVDLLTFAHLLTDKYSVLIPDLPGWNESPRFNKKLTIHNYALYLKALLDYLHISSVTIVGHCMGGTLSIEITYLFPDLVNNLFLISVPYLHGTWGEKMFLHLAGLSENSPREFRRVFFLWRTRFINILLSFVVLQFKHFRRKLKYIQVSTAGRKKEKEDAVEENWVSLIHYDYQKVKSLTLPVHVIYGVKDLYVSESQSIKFFKLVPKATLDPIEAAGHLAPLETPQTLANIILRY